MIASFTALGVGKGKENLTNAKLRIRELQGKVTEKKNRRGNCSNERAIMTV